MDVNLGFMTMPGVGLLGMLLIGFLAGYIAERAMNRQHGLLKNIVVGVIGSLVGGLLAGAFDIQFYGFLGNLVVAVAGSVLILWVFGRGSKR
jgi:uncharacterized membrane protein YeaQ/YmgE (transglycosylase-associated protein family)